MSHEIWKKIKGFPDYEVSSHGRVKSNRRSWLGYPPQILSPARNPKGYFRILLTSDKKKVHNVYVHRLVAETFLIEPVPHYNFYKKRFQRYVVNHKNGDKTNSCLENLEWVTISEDRLHDHRLRCRQR